MTRYYGFELSVCEDCAQFRELTDNNFHNEAEEYSECGSCPDLDNEFIIIDNLCVTRNLIKKMDNFCKQYNITPRYFELH